MSALPRTESDTVTPNRITDNPDKVLTPFDLIYTTGDKMKSTSTTTPTATEITKATNPDDNSDNVLDFSSTLRQLRKTVDPDLIRQRAGRRDRDGNVHMVDYVEWHTVADILDETAPNWSHTVKNICPIGNIITVTVAITINGITREGIGTGNAITETGIKKAEHDALKRAAVKFGIARELYKREFDAIDTDAQNNTSPPQRSSSPIAQNIGDMITGKQLGMIRALAHEAALDAERECQAIMKCSVNALSKRAASDLIDQLQDLHRQAALPIRRAG
jgi:hypothetical protein